MRIHLFITSLYHIKMFCIHTSYSLILKIKRKESLPVKYLSLLNDVSADTSNEFSQPDVNLQRHN